MSNNTPPSIIFSIHFSCKVTSGQYQFMYVISHINYFVMLLINLKFCIMKFLSEVILLNMFFFKNVLDRQCHFDPHSGFFSD